MADLLHAEGPDWQRQRRLTAPAFNEQKSPLVWAESLRQAGDMLQSWLSHDASGFTSTSDDIRTLALDVLAYTGFQKSYAWRSKKEAAIVDQAMTYRDSLSIILANVLTIVVLSPRFFQLPCLPQRLRRVGVAIKEFKNYMLSQITEERRLEALGHAGSGTLVSNLVRASSEDSQGKSSQMKPLTIDEILGNIFVFNFAGHDTTAISMNYALMLLVARPDIQDWIGEEVKFYLKDGQSATWKYEDSFEKLKRCRAILLETLRLYNPLPGIIKYTSTVQTLKVNGKSLHIPTNTLVVPALQTLHTHPKYWGADSLSWQPERWIRSSPPSSQTQGDTPSILNEELLEPEKGTFIAWSEGMKKCPGKKFAQVEAVAVLARLFRDHRVDPVPMNGCSTAQMLAKVMAAVEDSDVELLLGMRDPRSVSVQWRKT
ncbi:uncharacterized protein KY384_000516 [Bacidia gigantensis]|uniref:uncharacterized protein n=1 Tax=Bacidia gigantensis TaxID=2732470 RepID=UPI001D047C1B|nr:uncharacterized protein KY384_000516 [Bacidia gigantensis]KAG8525756.1 hypothetical protein KY384_000516 [Bacidia gigantensis]